MVLKIEKKNKNGFYLTLLHRVKTKQVLFFIINRENNIFFSIGITVITTNRHLSLLKPRF